jgi:demethylmenaquinone methyltransferase/2-methoxy-6-polyprenyl-1,4-benzoquinol methylase
MITRSKMNRSLNHPDTKRAYNKDLFTAVAKKYAMVTQLLSFGFDGAWKSSLVQQLPAFDAPHCLDLACGTGDISLLLAARYPQGHIIGVDITPAMLAVARANNISDHLTFIEADMNIPPVADQSMDIITGGYALRNSPDLDQLLQTIWNKLKPGGVATFLDFSKSDELNRQRWQMRLLMFWTGLCSIIMHANPTVHNYIPASLKSFPTRKALQDKIEHIGFTQFKSCYHHNGFIARISFVKPIHDAS